MNIKLFLLSIAAIAGTSLFLYSIGESKAREESDHDAAHEFSVYREAHGKRYSSASEMAFRQRVFSENLRKVRSHNADPLKSYSLGLNQFSDMTYEELRSKYLIEFPRDQHAKCETAVAGPKTSGDPKEVDWVAAGKVHAPKDQKHCGSCWAFSAVGALESAYAIFKGGNVPSISEQELLDCSRSYGNNGCNGGLMCHSFDYIMDNHINSEEKYPYAAVTKNCRSDLFKKGEFGLRKCVKVGLTVDDLVYSLRQQPVSVAFFVQPDFFSYSGGVYNPRTCQGSPNHAVLAVGFKLDAPIPYFFVKNSWGDAWGEQGYFKISMGTGSGTCDLAGSDGNFYPLV